MLVGFCSVVFYVFFFVLKIVEIANYKYPSNVQIKKGRRFL